MSPTQFVTKTNFGLIAKRFQSYHFGRGGQIPKQWGLTRRSLYNNDSLDTQTLSVHFALEVYYDFHYGYLSSVDVSRNNASPNTT